MNVGAAEPYGKANLPTSLLRSEAQGSSSGVRNVASENKKPDVVSLQKARSTASSGQAGMDSSTVVLRAGCGSDAALVGED